jgi:hypothetical protein
MATHTMTNSKFMRLRAATKVCRPEILERRSTGNQVRQIKREVGKLVMRFLVLVATFYLIITSIRKL